jgi:CrcB protein
MANPLMLSILVGCGGFVGSVARYGLSVSTQRFSSGWPLGTIAANVIGSLLIGIITGLSVRGAMSPEVRLTLATGFCGGFTTMSSMIYETADMLRASEYLRATLYASGSFFLSLAAYAVGVLIVYVLFKQGGGSWS